MSPNMNLRVTLMASVQMETTMHLRSRNNSVAHIARAKLGQRCRPNPKCESQFSREAHVIHASQPDRVAQSIDASQTQDVAQNDLAKPGRSVAHIYLRANEGMKPK